MTSDAQQNGKSVENAKPIGYYWRAAGSGSRAGVGGYYDVLGPNTISFEDGSYIKLRELSLSYNVGTIKRIPGNWSVTAVGRNLYTWTKYTGWDPDIGGGRRTDPNQARSSRAAVLELSADAQLHAHALLQVLTAIGGLARGDDRAQADAPRLQETR